MKLGFLTVYGPNSNSQVACTAGQTCTIQLVGYIAAGDKMAFMPNNCGIDAKDPSVGGDVYHPLVYSSGTSTWDVSLAGGEGGATERGGIWHMCYCASSDGTACDMAGDYAASAGTLTLYGPLPNQDPPRFAMFIGSRCLILSRTRGRLNKGTEAAGRGSGGEGVPVAQAGWVFWGLGGVGGGGGAGKGGQGEGGGRG